MARYAIRYSETYSDTYIVEADSYTEAKEKVYDAICDNDVIGPEYCTECHFMDVSESYGENGLMSEEPDIV